MHPPNGATKPTGGAADGCDGPRLRGFNEQLLPVDEFGGDGTPRIHASPRAVHVDKTKSYVTDLVPERPKDDRELARGMFPQAFDRFNPTGTNQEIHWNLHENLPALAGSSANESALRCPAQNSTGH